MSSHCHSNFTISILIKTEIVYELHVRCLKSWWCDFENSGEILTNFVNCLKFVIYLIPKKNPFLSRGKHVMKVKGKGRLWVLQHCCPEAYCTLTRMSSFIHLQRRCTHQAA